MTVHQTMCPNCDGNLVPGQSGADCAVCLLQPMFSIVRDIEISNTKKRGRKGDLDGAIAIYKKLIEFHPERPDHHASLGMTPTNKGRLDEGLTEFHDVIQLTDRINKSSAIPADNSYNSPSSIHEDLANALGRYCRYQAAEVEFCTAICRSSESDHYHNDLGIALAANHRYKEAEAEYREAVRLRPDDPVLHHNLASALDQLGRNREAEAECRAAVRLKPNCIVPEIHHFLGRILAHQGCFKEAGERREGPGPQTFEHGLSPRESDRARGGPRMPTHTCLEPLRMPCVP